MWRTIAIAVLAAVFVEMACSDPVSADDVAAGPRVRVAFLIRGRNGTVFTFMDRTESVVRMIFVCDGVTRRDTVYVPAGNSCRAVEHEYINAEYETKIVNFTANSDTLIAW